MLSSLAIFGLSGQSADVPPVKYGDVSVGRHHYTMG